MKKKEEHQVRSLYWFFLLTSNQVDTFVSTFVANVEDIYVIFVITKYENIYGFVLSSQLLPLTSKNYSKFSKSHRSDLKGYFHYKTILGIK